MKLQPQVSHEELKAACAAARQVISHSQATKHAVPLSNGWTLTAGRIYPCVARSGPAWYILYNLVSPTGKTFGGRNSQAELISHFGNPNRWQWVDSYERPSK